MFQRKIIAASLTSSLFPLVLPIIFSFEEGIFGLATIYMMYSLPVIFVYGIGTSLVSDWVAKGLTKKRNKLELLLSFLFHTIFGLVLFHISLIAAWLFFAIDRLLRKKQANYRTKTAFLSLLIPACLFLVLLVLIR